MAPACWATCHNLVFHGRGNTQPSFPHCPLAPQTICDIEGYSTKKKRTVTWTSRGDNSTSSSISIAMRPAMLFGDGTEALARCNTVTVQYKDRVWEIELNSETGIGRDTSSIACDLQAALNLSRPPVGLRLQVPPGTDPVLCPLSVLVVCPTVIASTFQGMSWVPMLEGGEDEESVDDDLPSPPPTDDAVRHEATIGSPLPPPLGSPLKVTVPDQDLSLLVNAGSTASPAEGYGRPLTAPAGDRTRGRPRPRPSRREGQGRPSSATPSDKSFGMRQLRPGKSEGYGRPYSALPSDHSGSGTPAWRRVSLGSPHGFGCDEHVEDDARPATAPAFAALRRRSSSTLSASRDNRSPLKQNWTVGQRLGQRGVEEDDLLDAEYSSSSGPDQQSLSASPGSRSDAAGVGWGELRGIGRGRECWA